MLPALVDIELRARQVPPEAVEKRLHMRSIKPARHFDKIGFHTRMRMARFLASDIAAAGASDGP
ncbi:hypothetical protein GCM10010320_72250 [Streptomyces caelestis]|nr:hypothetical protein GCM10010320_72250 [Streptomyces caelestis]